MNPSSSITIERLRADVRRLLDSLELTRQAVAIMSATDISEAVGIVLQCASLLSRTLFRPSESERAAIHAALEGLDRTVLGPLDVPAFERFEREQSASPRKVAMELDAETWTVRIEGEELSLLAIIESAYALDAHLARK